MKKILVNSDDISFENKHKFKDLINNAKLLSSSIIKNGKKTCILALTVGGILVSVYNMYDFVKEDLIGEYDYLVSVSSLHEQVQEHNDALYNAIEEDVIIITNLNTSFRQDYYFEDGLLYDSDKNIVDLTGMSKILMVNRCNIDEDILSNINLSSSNIKEISFDLSSINNNFVNYLPKTLETLSINGCDYVTDLSLLPEYCPNIKYLSLNSIACLSDFSFIYKLKNLEAVYIGNSGFITEDLLNYLTSNNIKTDISTNDVNNCKMLDEVISKIIKPDMSDKRKIQAVCLYVLDNIEYDIKKSYESNRNPLLCVLDDGKGVCASYSYLTSILLSKAGINSFSVSNGSHGWNIVELDNKYYYIDTTNMDDSTFYNLLLRLLNICKYYMVDTDNTFLSPMTKPYDGKTIIPTSLIREIEEGKSEKEIFEKYSQYVGTAGIILGYILHGFILGFASLGLTIMKINTPSYIKDVKKDYQLLKEMKKENI